MIVLTGSLVLSNTNYWIRYDSTANEKSWKVFQDNVTLDDVRSLTNIPQREVAFATYTKDGESPSVWGNMQLASMFLNELITLNSLTQKEHSKSESGFVGDTPVTFRTSSHEDSKTSTAKIGHTLKTRELAFMSGNSPNMILNVEKSKGRARFNFSGLDPETDFEPMDILADKVKGVTVALQFPTLEELMARFDLSYIFDKAGKLIRDYRIMRTEEELDAIIESKLSKAQILSVDVETTGLMFSDLPPNHPANNKIVDIIISWEVGQSILIPFAHTEVAYNFDPHKTLKKLEKYFTSIPCVGAHTKFDQRVLMFYGVDINFTEDVLLMWYNMDPVRAKMVPNLKSILNYFGREQPSLHKIAKGAETSVYLFPEYLMYCYCCADSDNTLWLYLKLREMLPKTSIYGYKQDIKVSKYLSADEYYTTHLDVAMLHKAIACADEDKRYLEELMFKQVGQYLSLKNARYAAEDAGLSQEEINSLLTEYTQTNEYKMARYTFDPTQDEQLRKILYEIYGIKPIAVTKQKKLSVSAPTLKKYISEERKEPISDAEKLKENVYSTVSKGHTHLTEDDAILIAKKYNSTKFPFIYVYSRWKIVYSEQIKFFYPLRKMVADTQGRVCLSFRITHTETYRITHKLQTLKGVLKSLVVPPSQHYCCGADAAAIEYRVVANEANETTLIISLTDPERDYHKEVAAIAFNKLAEEITKDERKQVKPVNFGSIYGISPYGLCTRSLGMPATPENLKFAEELIATIKMAIPKIFQYLESCATIAVKTGAFLNADNRLRIFDLEKQSESRVRRQALNFPIQSYAAGIFRQIYLNMKDAFVEQGIIDKVKTYLLVHDEFQNYVHEDICPWQLCSIFWNKCTISHPNKAPYYLGVGFGDSWYGAKDDRSELPVNYLKKKAEEWDSGMYRDWKMPAEDVAEYVYNDMQAYMFNRYFTELIHYKGVDPINKTIETTHLAKYVKNYYIKGRIDHFVEMSVVKDNPLKLSYEDIAYLLITMHKLNATSLISKETGKMITKEELLSDKYVSYMKSTNFFGEGENIINIGNYLPQTIEEDDLDDLEISFESTMDLLDLPDSFTQGDYDTEVDIQISNSDDSEGLVSPTIQYDESGRQILSYEGVSTNFSAASLEANGYSVNGSMITIRLTKKSFDPVVTYVKSLLTNKLLGTYTVNFQLPTGLDKTLSNRVREPDWDYLKSLLKEERCEQTS